MRALIICLALVVSIDDARACSCAYLPPRISPADASTNVPTNAIVIVELEYLDPAQKIELRKASTNELVAVTRENHGDYWHGATFAKPTASLEANTSYVVFVEDPLRTTITTTFATGADVDTTPPTFSGLTSMAPETMQYPIEGSCVSGCLTSSSGNVSRIHIDYPAPPIDAVHVAFELYDGTGTFVDETTMPSEPSTLLGFNECGDRAPHLIPESNYCARVVAYDVAGNRSNDTPLCATAKTCLPKVYPYTGTGNSCEPVDECLPNEPAPNDDGCSVAAGGSIWLLLGLFAISRGRRR